MRPSRLMTADQWPRAPTITTSFVKIFLFLIRTFLPFFVFYLDIMVIVHLMHYSINVFPVFQMLLVNVSQSRGPAVQSRRGPCRLSLAGIGQGTLVCLEIRKTKIISIFGFEGIYSFISTAPCHKSQIHLF